MPGKEVEPGQKASLFVVIVPTPLRSATRIFGGNRTTTPSILHSLFGTSSAILFVVPADLSILLFPR